MNVKFWVFLRRVIDKSGRLGRKAAFTEWVVHLHLNCRVREQLLFALRSMRAVCYAAGYAAPLSDTCVEPWHHTSCWQDWWFCFHLFCTSLLFGFICECNMVHEHNFVFLFGNMVYHLLIVFVYFLGLDQDIAWFCFLCNFYWLPINFTKYYWSLTWTFCHWINP